MPTVDGTPTLVVDFAVDEVTARKRVAGHMRIGLFTPGDVATAGAISSIQATFVPARRVHAEATSNWTAESGVKNGNNIHWSAVSGQHRGTYNDHVSLVAVGSWSQAAITALRHIKVAQPATPELLVGKERIAPSVSAEETATKARQRVGLEETRACGAMIPGASKRNLKVNTVVDSVRIEDLWLPVYVGVYRYGTAQFTFAVDGATGTVYGARPTSPRRILTALGVFGLFIAGSIANQSYQEHQSRVRAERGAHDACITSLATATDAMKAGDAAGADEALDRSTPLCATGAGADSVQALADARVAVQEERGRQDARLRESASATFASLAADIERTDVALASLDEEGSSAMVEALQEAILPFAKLDPAPDGLPAVQQAVSDRELHWTAVSALTAGKEKTEATRYLLADEAYALGSAALTKVSPEYHARAAVQKLDAALTAGSRRVAKGAATERRKEAAALARAQKEQSEAAALAQLCGERPVPGGWDGGLSAVESYMQKLAHDPDSIDDEDCTMPVLTTACWRTSCTVRGKNAFGALIANRQTFYLGRDPRMPSRSVVLASE